jgi:hypothetical protein
VSRARLAEPRVAVPQEQLGRRARYLVDLGTQRRPAERACADQALETVDDLHAARLPATHHRDHRGATAIREQRAELELVRRAGDEIGARIDRDADALREQRRGHGGARRVDQLDRAGRDPQRHPAHIAPQLAATWAAWIADAALRRQVGQAGAERARTVFREDIMLASVRAVVEEVAAVTRRV